MALPKISGQTAELHSPELRLWRAVLFTAIHDALGIVYGVTNDRGKNKYARRRLCIDRAVTWFTNGGYNAKEFPLVCALAGLEPERVRASVMQAFRFKWGDDPLKEIWNCERSFMSREALEKQSAEQNWRTGVIKAVLDTTRHEGA